eukprot:CAMPEP_0183736652 /NCGR_PEP_ID=MMETSP0737-20130205/49881_1 /TAXON_ID=385413 /ORGANISM="Thalassiosira miniscula, Strain CCMP1093" /LENGTH=113 /DNA_ID=CAMNT_0025970711 /DNA_START=66 /DNA_END=404 /DNA_ORIENTATION=+
MVSFAATKSEKDASDDGASQEPQSIAEIVYSHFESFQRDTSSSSSATRAAAALRSDLLSAAVGLRAAADEDDADADDDAPSDAEINEQISTAVQRCFDAAFALVAASTSKKES